MATIPAFKVRGIETHSRQMWEWEHVRRLLEFARDNRMNALVFHQNDLVDQLVNPEAFLPRDWMKRFYPVYLHAVENNQAYIRRVAACAKELKIDFYLETKELWYRTYLLNAHPELMKEGVLCPYHPFWQDYLAAKLEALYENLPDLAGIIVSVATKESRLSIVNSRCQCETCRQTPAAVWYGTVIDTMHRACQKAGKRLIVRDFVTNPKDHQAVISASGSAPADVIISLKNTPHDFYPTFPDNPRIGDVGDHEQWIEYDVWGQFFSMGVFPCVLLDDLKRRMQYALSKGATGFIARTDWECMSEGSALDGPNLLNLYGAALLSYDVDADFDKIYREWLSHPLSSAFSVSDVPLSRGTENIGEVDLSKLRSVMDETWQVIEEGIYIAGLVFHEDGMYPLTLEDAWWIMTVNHSLADWDPTKASALEMTPANVRKLLAEKEAALARVRKLRDRISGDRRSLGLNPKFYEDLVQTFQMFAVYVEGFYYAARACILTKYALENGEGSARSEAVEAIGELERFNERLTRLVSPTRMHHYVYMMMDPGRLENLIHNLKSKTAGFTQ